jgi:hypothetical protein
LAAGRAWLGAQERLFAAECTQSKRAAPAKEAHLTAAPSRPPQEFSFPQSTLRAYTKNLTFPVLGAW